MTELVIRARLDFDKNDHPAMLGNDIYFADVGAEVFFKNPVAFLFQKSQRGGLAFAAKLQSLDGQFNSPLGSTNAIWRGVGRSQFIGDGGGKNPLPVVALND